MGRLPQPKMNIGLPLEQGDQLLNSAIVRHTEMDQILTHLKLGDLPPPLDLLGRNAKTRLGRREIMKLYQRVGFSDLGTVIKSRQVDYKLMTLERKAMDDSIERHQKWRTTMRSQIDWNLDFPFDPYTSQESCYHGGASIKRMG